MDAKIIQKIMYYAYVLESQKDEKLYIGYSSNLKDRFIQHQQGEVQSTKYRRPLELIFYESFKDKRDAQRREKYFKTDRGKSSLKQIIRFSRECINFCLILFKNRLHIVGGFCFE